MELLLGSFPTPLQVHSNIIGKIFTAILRNRLSDWAEDSKLLPEEQYGFRKNRRAVDCVFILNTVINEGTKVLGGILCRQIAVLY